MPHVSIVIPTYNHAEYLRKALESVCAQSYVDWEAVVVNNYSEDDTLSVISAFDDARIKVVNFSNSGVIAASRNIGIAHSTGEVIAFLDSDDEWFPMKLEVCLDYMGRGYDAVCHAELWTNNAGMERMVHYGPEGCATFDSLLFNGNCISTSALVVKRKYLDKVDFFSEDKEIITAEDYDLWIRLAQSGCKYGFVGDVLGIYRLHGANESKSAIRHMNAVLMVLQRHFDFLQKYGRLNQWRVRKRIAQEYYVAGRSFQKAGERMRSANMLAKSILRYPLKHKVWLALMLNVFASTKYLRNT